MATGTKLIVQRCVAFGFVLLLLRVATPTIFYNASSEENPRCVLGRTIRCHDSDCGNSFQRCGSNELLEVPEHQVCYKGVLLPASSTDLHSCPSTRVPGNSTLRQARACICETCPYPKDCQCFCTNRVRADLPVTCQGSRYPSLAKAVSKGIPPGLCSEAAKRPQWEIAFESIPRYLSDLVPGLWSPQYFAARSTFPPPSVPSSDRRDSCDCDIEPRCMRECQGVQEEVQK